MYLGSTRSLYIKGLRGSQPGRSQALYPRGRKEAFLALTYELSAFACEHVNMLGATSFGGLWRERVP
jgi:hypothetical protein